MFGARVINNVSGLGTTFIDPGLASRIAPWLYWFAFRSSATIFFHNSDDLELFLGRGIVRRDQARLLPGSGIDLDRFRPPDRAPRETGPFRFLLAGRLQWSEGIDQYVKAARIVRRTYPDAVFQLLGEAGANAMKAVPMAEVERWQAEGIIDYLGSTNDVRDAIEHADCIVLPSYREGLPRILLEGSAMGKPLIATDVPGCRDVVEPGVTGLLCPVRSADGLAAAMLEMAALPATRRREMGAKGRQKVERQFCESVVVERYLQAMDAA
ncbi:MAG: glycosyltransferase family 4 protein, partial [Sphingomicrobium sp.]